MADQRVEEILTVDICELLAALYTRDEHGTAAGVILDAVGDLLAGNKFELRATLILSMFAKFTV
jgi:hypothetical protein